jgi:hypothetical protein
MKAEFEKLKDEVMRCQGSARVNEASSLFNAGEYRAASDKYMEIVRTAPSVWFRRARREVLVGMLHIRSHYCYCGIDKNVVAKQDCSE